MSSQYPNPEHVDAEETIPKDLHRPGKLMVALVLIVFLGLIAAMFVVGYIPRAREAGEIRADAAEKAGNVPSVGVTRPRETVSTQEIALPADVRADQQTAIYARASGYIKNLHVDINDRVKAGQLLAEIDTPEVDAQLVQSKAALEQSKANLAKAQTDMELARTTLARYKDLQGAASAQEVDEKRSAYEDAVAGVTQAKSNVAVAEADVQRLSVLQGFEKVVAPFDGIITDRNYDIGALLSTGGGMPLFQLTQSDTLKVNINVPQVYASQIAIGEPAELSVRNYPNRQFKGSVSRPSGALSESTRTMLFELSFPNRDGLLYPGMYGQVRLSISQQNPVLVIPTSAMLFNASGTQVAMVQDGKMHYQNIEVGRDLGTEMEVVSGISKDAQIVSNPAAQLAEGVRVQPILQKVAEQSQPKSQPLSLNAPAADKPKAE